MDLTHIYIYIYIYILHTHEQKHARAQTTPNACIPHPISLFFGFFFLFCFGFFFFWFIFAVWFVQTFWHARWRTLQRELFYFSRTLCACFSVAFMIIDLRELLVIHIWILQLPNSYINGTKLHLLVGLVVMAFTPL